VWKLFNLQRSSSLLSISPRSSIFFQIHPLSLKKIDEDKISADFMCRVFNCWKQHGFCTSTILRNVEDQVDAFNLDGPVFNRKFFVRVVGAAFDDRVRLSISGYSCSSTYKLSWPS
jgi:hypothetical protein